MDLDVTYSSLRSSSRGLDLVDLRRALGDRTQAEAAELLGVTPNTWARWERGELQVHPARAQQLCRLGQLVKQYGEGPFWGLGIDGIRSVLDGLSVPDALLAHGPGRVRCTAPPLTATPGHRPTQFPGRR